MAQFSTYKNLELPDSPERYNIQVFNKNNMVIDSELNRLDLKDKSQDELLATKESLISEISRASEMETSIIQNLDAEIARASEVEKDLSDNIFDETERSIAAENNIRESLSNHINDELNPHKVTPAQLNLENVNNTADMDKPVSTAQQNAIDSAVSNHNIYTSSHNDIRSLISSLTTRLNALADSDDTTLDQLSEIVAYIKNNKSLIDGITTSKVNVSDIIDSLDSTATSKPLSANQGKILKELITTFTTTAGTGFLPLSGGTLTGGIIFSDSGIAVRGIAGQCGTNDWWRFVGGATAQNAGYCEIATGDDGNEPIYVRQYTGQFATVKRTLTLLDGNGNTDLPGSLSLLGQLARNGISKTWRDGRDGALIRTKSMGTNQYIPLASIKTNNGSWEIGAYTNNTLFFTYITDTDYNAGTNKSTAQISITPDGKINGKLNGNANNGITYSDSEPTGLTVGATWIGN